MARSPSLRAARRLVATLVLLGAAACASGGPRTAAPLPCLRSGPMVGATHIASSSIWLQTWRSCRAEVRYWPAGRAGEVQRSPKVTTAADGDFIARFDLSGLAPGTRYEYEIRLDGERIALPHSASFRTQPLWRWRNDPPPLRLALGSCHYTNDPPADRPGKPYGSGYEIFDAILATQPDAMLWLGDNVYYREPDWGSEAGMRARYAHGRELPELQALLAAVPQLAIWDDHDYGPNNSNRSFVHREAALAIFCDYWANPTCGGSPELRGTMTRVEWGDVELFLMDDRFHRAAERESPGPRRWMLGAEQMAWLETALASSLATFKIVAIGTQALNPIATAEAWSDFPEEQRRLLDFLRAAQIEGVLFATGDRHHAELIRREEPGLYPLYDFTTSPLTAGGGTAEEEAANPARVPGTWVTNGVHNFGLIEIVGPRGARRLTLRLLDQGGRELWRHELAEAELRFAKGAPPSP